MIRAVPTAELATLFRESVNCERTERTLSGAVITPARFRDTGAARNAATTRSAFHGVDMDLMETVTVLVTGILPATVADGFVFVSPLC